MAETFAVKIAKEQAKLKRQSSTATAAQRLQHASIEDTFLPVKDREGQVVATWGKQPDGSFGGSVKQSPEQPTPSAPILPKPVEGERVPNNFPVEWDGGTVSGSVPEVHGRTDVWFQIVEAEGSVDPEAWRLGGSIRDRLGGATTIVVPDTGIVAVAFQMVGADRVTKGEFSAPSFVTVTARVDAQDIADRLAAFADGELPDGAYNNLMARLGEFLQVRAGQIDVNSLAADTAFIALLETAGIILADEAAGFRTEVSGQGLRVIDQTTGDVITQLGTFTDSLFTIIGEDGVTPAATITKGGGLSAVRLSSQHDPTFGGKPFAGAQFGSARWHIAESVVDLMPRGVVAHWPRTFQGETFVASSSQIGVGVAHMEATLQPNRVYKLACDQFEMGDRTNYWMQALVTTSSNLGVRPPRPSFSSALLGPRVHGTVPPSGVSSYGTALRYEWVRTYSVPVRLRVIFLVGNSSNVGNVHGSLSRNNAMFSIEDVGPSTGPKGYTIAGNGNLTSESIPPIPDDLSQAYTATSTATYTLNPSTRIATRAYTDGVPRFGHWNSGVTYMTLVNFTNWDAQPGVRRAAQFDVSVQQWLRSGTGNIFQSAVPTFTGFPASFNFDTELINLPDQRNVSRYATRTVAVEGPALESVLNRSSAVVAVGRTGWGSESTTYQASGQLSMTSSSRLSTELGGGIET